MGRPPRGPAHRHPGLAGGADLQRIRALRRLLCGAGAGVRHHRSAGGGVHGRPPPRRGPARGPDLQKRASLAVLSDERNAHLFDAQERQAIDAHIPWTRRVEERRTVFRGLPVDLVPLILEHHEQFVLKANDEYGGRGITLGWETDAETWERTVVAAVAEPTVVQERVLLPREPFPSMIDGRLQIFDRMLDIDPFIVYGATAEGCVTRPSTASLLNVTVGGGSTNRTFVGERR